MEVTTIDSVGRIVVPKPLRDALGLTPGTKLDVSRYGAGLQLVPAGRTARLAYRDGVLVGTGGTVIGADTARQLPEGRGRLAIAGGAVHDALVALAAVEHDATLATRDARARSTYELVGARVVVAG